MGNIIFSIFAWVISILPFWLLYRVSDLAYLFIFYIYRYRRGIVYHNLKNSFPDKDDKEIFKISKKYYRNLTDILVEVIKMKSISLKELQKRVVFSNIEVINDLYEKNKSAFVLFGHCGNWEWLGPIMENATKHRGFAVYKPLTDSFFNRYMMNLRRRFYTESDIVPDKQILRTLIKFKNELTITVLIADQTPAKDEINWWSLFLNQETPFYNGPEKLAKTLGFPVIFLDIQRRKRGYYIVKAFMITDNPVETRENEITEQYIRLLENAIIQNPDNWLWSHKKWKHKKDDIFNQ